MKRFLLFLLVLTLVPVPPTFAGSKGIKIVEPKNAKQFDVYVDGKLFTSYRFDEGLKKPLLYPLKTAKGTIVTRQWPLANAAGERNDHPHHIGAWFNYGSVNGVDFWDTPPAGIASSHDASKMGVIKQQSARFKNNKDTAEITAKSDWVMPDGSKILQQDERLVFRAGKDWRAIDRIITLTAQDKKVVFDDTKEGAFGIRVARQLEEPSKEPAVFTDANRKPTKVPQMDNAGVAGVYLSSEGKTGEKEVWGKRAKWMTLSGNVKGEDLALAIFDHPKNPTYPTYWHARGYGLFAANPFGAKDFTKGATTLNYTLQPGEKLTLRFRILIHSGKLTKEQTEGLYQQFLKDVTE